MDIGKAISSTGDLLFEFAFSLISIPKTFFKILIHPTWATDYLTSLTSEKAKARFEKYSHPIFFWILVGVIPYFAIIHFHFIGGDEVTKNMRDAYKTIGTANIISGLAIFLVSFPVSCAFILQLFKYKDFVKSTFKRSFFIQLYLTAPVQFLYLFSLFATMVESKWLALLFLVLSLGSILWFLIAETHVIKKETQNNYLISFFILILMYLIFFVFAGICMVIFFFMHMDSIQVLVDTYFRELGIPLE